MNKTLDFEYPVEKKVECLRCGIVLPESEFDRHITLCLERAEALIKQKETICQEAERIINGPRRDSYGPVEESFVAIAKAWSGYLHKKLKQDLTKEDVAMLQVIFKTIREGNQHKRDNLVDIVGYTLLSGKLNGEI